jgi:hypothetical protein
MATPTATPMYRTVCKHCGVTMQVPAFTPMIGADVNPEVIQFVLKLQKHMLKAHPVTAQQMQGSIAQFTGFACVANFGIQDPILIGMQEAVRAALHRFTRRAFITDEQIRERLEELRFGVENSSGMLTLDASGLFKLLKEFRDILCEEGAYAPSSSPASTPLVTP